MTKKSASAPHVTVHLFSAHEKAMSGGQWGSATAKPDGATAGRWRNQVHSGRAEEVHVARSDRREGW